MSTAQLLEQLRDLSDVERLEVIEAATRLIRKNLAGGTDDTVTDRGRRIGDAAAGVKDLYESDRELTEWTALDADEFSDDYLQR